MGLNGAIHRFAYDGWDVVVELGGVTPEGVISGHADLQLKGERKCRLALDLNHQDGASAIASLAQKSRAFIDDWDIKRGEGSSPFIER